MKGSGDSLRAVNIWIYDSLALELYSHHAVLLAHGTTPWLEEATYTCYGFMGTLGLCFQMKMANDFGAVKHKNHPQFSICFGYYYASLPLVTPLIYQGVHNPSGIVCETVYVCMCILPWQGSISLFWFTSKLETPKDEESLPDLALILKKIAPVPLY